MIGAVYAIHTVVIFIDSQWDIKPFADSVPKDRPYDPGIGERQSRTLP
jgi:hypothetical protein